MSEDDSAEFIATMRFGRYEIPVDAATGERRKLGEGGMGVTYKARDATLGRLVVLKVISRALQRDPMAKKRFLREAKALALLKHPGIPVIYEFGEEGGDDFYAMEFVEGLDLQERVKRAGALPMADALGLIEQAARALGAAHRAGIVHRDIKPANLMLTRAGQGEGETVKLIDFGLAKGVSGVTDFGLSSTGNAAGFTPLYASPEQFKGDTATEQSDLYSLGATLWCLLTGQAPFTGTSLYELLKKHMEVAPPFDRLPARLPNAVRGLIERLLAKRPEDRPASADEVAGEIAGIRRMLAEPIEPTSVAESLGSGGTVHSPAAPVSGATLREEPRTGTDGFERPAGGDRGASGAGGRRATDRPTETPKRGFLPTLWILVIVALAAVSGGSWWMGSRTTSETKPPVRPTRVPTPVPQSAVTPRAAPMAGPYVISIRKAAEQGDAGAQFKLGVMFGEGRGVAKDDAEAVRWYRKAAEQGYAKAQYNLGRMLDKGEGATKDEREAVSWYRKAAEQGLAFAQTNLALMLEDGRGVAKNEKEAVSWYQKAAEQGDALAQNNLGLMLAGGRGVAKDEKEAVIWYRKAAELGNDKAQNNLGLMLVGGSSMAKDEEEAAIWFRKAAEQGNAAAQNNLGLMLGEGRGVAKDEKEAVSWYRKAAEQGDADAQLNLGAMLEFGRGVTKDEKEAVSWYQKAAEQGQVDAKAALERISARR